MRKNKDWFKYRGYPHISNDIPYSKRREVYNYVKSSKNIAKHKFLPLISKNIIQRRYKLNGNGTRSHRVFEEGEWKSTKKVRVIEYPCHLDSHIYSYYNHQIIQPQYEKLLSKNSKLNSSVIAYRKIPVDADSDRNKCNIHFAKEVFDEIKQRRNCVALLYDIKNFFPTLDHKILKKAWANVLGCKSLPKDHYNIYKSITNYSFINLNDLKVDHRRFDEKKLSEIRKIGKHSYFHSVKDFVESEIKAYKNHAKTKGIPHGLPISALMANIYMYEFDKEITEHLVGTSNVFYRRYSDDMIFVCDNSEVEVVDEFISKSIEDIKLEIAKDKIETIYFKATENGIESSIINDLGNFVSGPLNYLGFEFYGNKTLIKTKNIGAFYREMKESIGRKSRRVESLKSELLVDKLPIFKRKIYRLYSYKGGRPRELTINNGSGKSVRKKEYRGNFISYVFKASEIMGAPEMKKQVRNHWKILQKTIRKYEFSNLKS